MSETIDARLSGVPETMLITLYIRAMESQRPDALIKDERAEALVRRLDQDTLRTTIKLTDDFSRAAVILKSREFDRVATDFLTRHPESVVVHIGCGLDTRFQRVDNGQVEWYDLDLPDVIALRSKLIGDAGERNHVLACSVLDRAWLEQVRNNRGAATLFLAEGVFMYLDEAQVKSLVLTLRDQFPGAELVFDAFSPFLRWGHNSRVRRTGVGAYLHWALRRGRDLERWGDGIRLLDERFPFLAKGIGIYHYQL